MNYLWLLLAVALLLLVELTFLLFKRCKDPGNKDTSKQQSLNKGSQCQELEDCWCCEYNLSKQKKEKLLEEFETLHCGKSFESMLKNK